jgi:hypothetical protein
MAGVAWPVGAAAATEFGTNDFQTELDEPTMGTNVAKISSLLLAVLLQFSPLLKMVQSTSALASSPFAIVLKWATAAAAMWGGYHAVSGASCNPARITSPTSSVGTNGTAYSYIITQCSAGTDRGHAFTASNRPPNLSLTTFQNGVPAYAILSGTPTNFGVWLVRLQAFYTNGAQVLASVPTNLLLTIYGKPVVTNPPVSVAANAGADASFSVTAGGLPAPSYRWRLGTTTLGGETNATLNLTNINAGHAGDYTVVASNFLGSITSSVATLTVNAGSGPSITTPPQDATVLVGGATNFFVIANGSPPLSYFWLKNGIAIDGANSATNSLNNISTNDAGAYSAILSNSLNTVTSAAASLYVMRTPSISSVGKVGDQVSLLFFKEPGAPYQVLFSPSVPTNLWQTLTNVPAQSQGNISLLDAMTNGQSRFYQLRLTIP